MPGFVHKDVVWKSHVDAGNVHAILSPYKSDFGLRHFIAKFLELDIVRYLLRKSKSSIKYKMGWNYL